jgi:hypothetical protein
MMAWNQEASVDVRIKSMAMTAAEHHNYNTNTCTHLEWLDTSEQQVIVSRISCWHPTLFPFLYFGSKRSTLMIHECHMNMPILSKDTRAGLQEAIQQYAIVTCIGLSFNVRKVELNQVKWFLLVLMRSFEVSRIDLKAHVMTASSNVFDIVDGLIVYCV